MMLTMMMMMMMSVSFKKRKRRNIWGETGPCGQKQGDYKNVPRSAGTDLQRRMGPRDQRKRLTALEVNQEFVKGTYGQKPSLGQQQDSGSFHLKELDICSFQEHSWLAAK